MSTEVRTEALCSVLHSLDLLRCTFSIHIAYNTKYTTKQISVFVILSVLLKIEKIVVLLYIHEIEH